MTVKRNILPCILLLAMLTACSPSDETATVNAEKTAPTSNDAVSTKQVDDFPHVFEQINENSWVMHGPRELPNPENKGFMNNPGIIKTSAGLVIIDPGSTVHIGENVLEEIKTISDLPIVATFNTHVHGDHWLANQAIKAAYPDVKIYGHQNMLDEIADGAGEEWVTLMDNMTEGASKGTEVVAPDNAVNSDDVIKVGNTQFKIHHYGIAHTRTDIMIEVVEESIVFLGDNVLAKRIPRMTDGNFQGSISSINSVLETNAKHYVPGHGPTGDSSMVKDYLNYLTLIYEAAQQAFEDDLDSSDVLAITKETTAAYKDWYGYEELLGPQGAQAYSEVEEAEF